MKTTLSLCLALAALTSARAQIFRPEAVNGAVLGGIAGAVIGNNSGDLHHNAWKGAAIGAGAGLILGEAVGNANAAATNTQVVAPSGGYASSGYGYRNVPASSVSVGVSYGRGYGHGYHGRSGYYHPGYRVGYGYYSPGYTYAAWPSYSYYSGYGDAYPYYDNSGYYSTPSSSGSAAANGLVLGGIAGAVIGNNSGSLHHSAWRGAAWGAGLGWLLGAVADANRPTVYRSEPVAVQAAPAQAPVQVVQQASQAPSAPATPRPALSSYRTSTSSMSEANSLFGR